MKHIPGERHTTSDETPMRPVLLDETKFAAAKIAVFQYVVVMVFLFLLAGYWDLQVRNAEIYDEKAERNQIRSLPIPAPRGKILDRDGRVAVDNLSSYRLLLSRENLREEHIVPIAMGLNLDPKELAGRVRRYANRPKFEAMFIKEELTESELTFVETHRGADSFPEMELIGSQRRVYPKEGMLAHLLGYVGEINDPELNSPEFARYNPGDLIGKFGIERQYNDHLAGKDGQRQVRVDNLGRHREVLGIKEAEAGKDLTLTLDLDLQAVAELAMEGRRGAVVALDPRNGEVLAMVSKPAFDPNHFVGRIDPEEWNRILSDPDKPMFNRAIQAQRAPGSTFKPVVALAALETGLIDESFTVHCGGGAMFYDRYFKCHAKKGHGRVNLHTALAQSCDVFFYTVGNKLGIDALARYGEMAGFGRKTGIDLPQEKEGIMPSSRWKIRTFREKWYAGETVSVAIGQGALAVTPLQLATAIGGIATGGVWRKPHVVRESAAIEPVRKEPLKAETVNRIVNGMYAVVNSGGTGSRAYLPGLEVCGKTGTAQPVSNELIKAKKLEGFYKDDAWFVAFAPRQEPEIVVAAYFEGGEHGNLAAPIARDVIKAHFDKQAKKARPPAALAQTFGPLRPLAGVR